MMSSQIHRTCYPVSGFVFSVLCLLLISEGHAAAQVTAAAALGLRPIQGDVDYDAPTEEIAAKCSVQSKTDGQGAGWIVLDPAGQLLRRFLDTNGDNRVDLWCYYKGGVEVYRDIDGNFNSKADQYRWLGTEGLRWGVDDDEDGRVDRWKMISAEEVTAEVVAALRTRDAARFQAALPTSEDVASLGLGGVQQQEIIKKVTEAARSFPALAQKQTAVTAKSKWVNFGASQPGVVPAGWEGSTKDVIVYDNCSAIIETDGKHAQIVIGTLVQVGQGWRVIDLPTNLQDTQTAVLPGGYFFRQGAVQQPEAMANSGGLNETVQKLIRDLEQVEKGLEAASGPEQAGKLHASRADILQQLVQNASTAEERDAWMRQLADGISAAVQSGAYAEGVNRLKDLCDSLAKGGADQALIAFVKFRHFAANYGSKLLQPNADFAKIQEEWLADLRQFVQTYPRAEDAPEAMLQLAVGEEFAGKTEDALAWYARILEAFPNSPNATKAAGARRRLESVGKSLELAGPTLDGKTVSLAQYRGRMVLIHYWATWCEPCKQDMLLLRQLQAKYVQQGFALLGVNLDSDAPTADRFLKTNSLPWPHLYTPGGLDSRLAAELGVLTLPTMILVDKEGKVINRNIHAAELDEELGKRLR